MVLFHAKESYFPLGYLGVDVFFVISGFVVTPLMLRIFTEQGTWGTRLSNLKSFYRKRFYRLAPALAVTLIISTVLVFFLGPIADHPNFTRQGIATLLLAGNFGAFKYSGDYFAPNPNALVHTWSLSVEEQIYVFLPLILMLILHNRGGIKKIMVFVLGVFTAISFISFLFPAILQPLYSRLGIQIASQFSFYSPTDRLWQFTLGGLSFLLLVRYQVRIKKIPRWINCISVIAVSVALFGSIHMNLKPSSILASVLAVIVIVFKSLDVLPNFLTNKLEWLGDRSYSIYLVHMPLLYIAKYSPMTQMGISENRVIQSIVAVVATIVLGSICYSRIEKRFRVVGNGHIGEYKTVSTILIVMLIIPLFILVIMREGEKQNYWGLDKNPIRPAYAGSLDPNCERDSKSGPPCIYRNVGATKTLLLIGDSHAGQISQAVIDAAKNANWNTVVWSHGGCKVQFQRSISGQVSDNCIATNLVMKEWVLRSKPNAVIVSQYVYSDLSQPDLRNALTTLKLMVPVVLFIENNPVFPDVKDFMIARPILGSLISSPYMAPKYFKTSKMQYKDKGASDELAMWARENGFSTMNFSPLFCDKYICSRFANNSWLYLDADHFSVVGAARVIPQIEAFLVGIQ